MMTSGNSGVHSVDSEHEDGRHAMTTGRDDDATMNGVKGSDIACEHY
jgi:hypothetical protein